MKKRAPRKPTPRRASPKKAVPRRTRRPARSAKAKDSVPKPPPTAPDPLPPVHVPSPRPRLVRPPRSDALARTAPPPHVTAPRPLSPPSLEQLLSRVQRFETVEAGYEVWQELRENHRAVLSRLTEERARLHQQGEFVVGAVRAARAESPTEAPIDLPSAANAAAGWSASASAVTVPAASLPAASAPSAGLDAFLDEAAARLGQAKRALEVEAEASARQWESAFAMVRQELKARVQRQLQLVKPRLRLRLRALANGLRILHIDRPTPDEAVLLCALLSGKLPTRYGFLFDDATDDTREAPPTLYAEEGIAPQGVRPDAATLATLLGQPTDAVPLKGVLALQVPPLYRLVQRGPVMEAEVADGPGFRNLLQADEAERLAGHLLKLKLEGRIELELLSD